MTRPLLEERVYAAARLRLARTVPVPNASGLVQKEAPAGLLGRPPVRRCGLTSCGAWTTHCWSATR
jgi:hypothetical protein